METPVLATANRRYDIDWLRIAAVLLLIPFHTARVFNVGEDLYAKNPQLSDALERFIVFVGPWHMSLLFVLAGAATWFALGFRSGGRYAGERLQRLLVPFLFGLVVIIPPQAYVGMLTNTTRSARGGASTPTSGRTGRTPRATPVRGPPGTSGSSSSCSSTR